MTRAAALAVATLAAGCTAFPGAAQAGRRALEDGFVSLTAPVQVPVMAAREAWAAGGGEDGRSRFWLPLDFVGCCFVEAGLCALHALDLVATPVHVVVGNGPAGIYRTDVFPMERQRPAFGEETGELALYGIGSVAGAAIAWWFGSHYVPHLFRWFTG